jgi:hypothetical protein
MTMEPEVIRRRLQRILQNTENASNLRSSLWPTRRKADAKLAEDDLASGRVGWSGAHQHARLGLDALDQDEPGMAEAYLWVAMDFYMDALESRLLLRPSDLADLGKTIKSRGRRLGSASTKGRTFLGK